MDDNGSLPQLPPEIITDIMTRVPVKPIIRFRCVSKRFCTLIDSPHFLNKHLIHYTKTNTNPKLVVSDIYNPRLYSVNYHEPIKKSKKNKQVVVELYPPVMKIPDLSVLVFGSCNGLLFLSSWQGQLVFWNPTTGKQWNLPPLVRSPPRKIPLYQTKCAYGFGHVSHSSGYKAVRIRHCYDQVCMVLVTEVDVYSLRSNSWRKIEGFPYANLFIRSQPAVLVNECLHWPATMKPYELGCYDLIVGFGIESESFGMVPLPDIKLTGGDMAITALGGCLCAYYHFDEVGLDIWVMKEYGVKKSWTKLFRVDPKVWNVSDRCTWLPITYTRDGDKVLFQRYLENHQGVISYDLVRKTVEKVDIYGMPNHFVVMSCSESLVNPNGGLLDGKRNPPKQKAEGRHRKEEACSSKRGNDHVENRN